MSRSELLNDYEALRELQKAFEEGATLSKPHPSGGFHDVRGEDLAAVVRHLDNVVANLRRQLSAEYSPAEPPERLAEALLSLDLQPNQRAHVHEALETFVAYERAACAALVEQAVSKWSAEHPDDSIPVRAYIDDLKKLGEEMRARGRSRSSGR